MSAQNIRSLCASTADGVATADLAAMRGSTDNGIGAYVDAATHVGVAAEAVAAACYHCGEPSRDLILELVDGRAEPFCCRGCAAAASWIRSADLGAYYRLRSERATRVGMADADLGAWDCDELLDSHVREVDGCREITVLVEGMRCAACAWLIDRALTREAGVSEVVANAITGRVRITWNPALTALSSPLRRLLSLGYRPYLAAGENIERERRQARNRWLLRVGVAGLGAMQAMMFAEASYFDVAGQMSLPTRDFLRWMTFLAATPVVFYSGWPFLAGAWHELRTRVVGMDSLIAGSTLLAYFASLVATVRGGPQVWFDAAVMFVFLLLIARALEQRARAAASAQVDALARARPAFATRELHGGRREWLPVHRLQVGDIACVAAGDVVPADGRLLDARASFEEALLTGEPLAVHKHEGDLVLAGTLCLARPVRLRLTEVGSATRLAQLTRLVELAQEHRPRLARLADRVAGRFVAMLLLVAASTWLAWHWRQPERAFEVTLALLVISCPCALSLAVPAVLASAHGALARLGVLSVRAEALEQLSRVTDVVFDKTGTLSDGAPALASVDVFGGFDRKRALDIAAALEIDSGHPLAAAFALHRAHVRATQVETVAGLGVRGLVGGAAWRLGQSSFAAGGADDGNLWLGDGANAVARFSVEETQRPDCARALAALRAAGLVLHLSSGDGSATVGQFASRLGIADARSRQSPGDKLAMIRELQGQGRIVLMIGDGLNDAPVLAGADVSIAMASGASLAQRSADLVLTANALLRIPQAIAIARRARRIIRQNIAWAVAYNLLALPVAACGLVTPWMAAVGMALSSLTVTANALRLGRNLPS